MVEGGGEGRENRTLARLLGEPSEASVGSAEGRNLYVEDGKEGGGGGA